MRSDQAEHVLNELHAALEDRNDVPISSLLRKAARLAALLDMQSYQTLFQMHLDGVRPERGFQRVHFGSEENARICRDAFMADRTMPDGRIMGHGAAMIEELHRRMLEHREHPEGVADDAVQSEFELRATIQRMKNRLSLFSIDAERRLHSNGAQSNPRLAASRKIFIGHGRSEVWKQLRDFLRDRLALDIAEFDREPAAGLTVTERLETMLAQSCFAFLVMTPEDSHPDGTMHPRLNVVHELGLCQGKLGRERAIVLMEEPCRDFSNIAGLVQVRFTAGHLATEFERIRQILERESIIVPQPGTG
jgi:predicted nucleotide-binding protein